MSSFSTYLENAVLSHVFKAQPLPSFTNLYAALYWAEPTDAGGGTELNNATAPGYRRAPVVFASPVSGVTSNATAIVFDKATGDWLNAPTANAPVALAIFPNQVPAPGETMLCWTRLSAAPVIVNGAAFSLAAGGLTISLT